MRFTHHGDSQLEHRLRLGPRTRWEGAGRRPDTTHDWKVGHSRPPRLENAGPLFLGEVQATPGMSPYGYGPGWLLRHPVDVSILGRDVD